MPYVFVRNAIVAPPPTTGGGGSGGSGVDGQVGTYAALNLSTYPTYSVDLAENDYPSWNGTGGSTVTHNSSGWWDGSAYARCVPPTVDQRSSGLGGFQNLHRSNTLSIQELNLRWEQRYGPTWASTLTTGTCPKHVIVNTFPSLPPPGGAEDRPMLFIEAVEGAQSGYQRADTMAFAPVINTVACWTVGTSSDYSTSYSAFADYSGYQKFYIGDSDGTHGGQPVVGAGAYLTFELRMIAKATAEYPDGLVAMRITRRTGEVYEMGTSFTFDAGASLGSAYFEQVEQLGTGYFNTAPAADAGSYVDVGGYVTIARDYDGWLGPRAGFVQ